MPHINLLPWRELQREQSKKKFITLLMAVVIACFVTMYALSTFYSGLKEGQMLKNNYLSSEITMLDQKIRDIRDLDKKKENLQQRMRLIEELQSSRNLGTQIMDEVAKIVPAGPAVVLSYGFNNFCNVLLSSPLRNFSEILFIFSLSPLLT